MRLCESSRRAEPTVVAPSPHVHCNAPRRCEQIATYDVIGAEAGWADFQYPVPGGEPWSDSVTHEPVERTRARFGAAIGTETVARRNAVGLETGHRPRANPADRFRGGRDGRSRAGSGPSRCARRLHMEITCVKVCNSASYQPSNGPRDRRLSAAPASTFGVAGTAEGIEICRQEALVHDTSAIHPPPAIGLGRNRQPRTACLVLRPSSARILRRARRCVPLDPVRVACVRRETGTRPPDAARLLLRCNNLTDPVAN